MSNRPMTRDEQELDTIYVCPDGGVFWTPDGEGRYWYDDLNDAQKDCGEDAKVVYLSVMPEDS